MYLIIGVSNTGSGSLTWPEDFDVLGYVEDEKEAERYVNAKNLEEGLPPFPIREDFPDTDEGASAFGDALEEYDDALSDHDGTVWEVIELDKLTA